MWYNIPFYVNNLGVISVLTQTDSETKAVLNCIDFVVNKFNVPLEQIIIGMGSIFTTIEKPILREDTFLKPYEQVDDIEIIFERGIREYDLLRRRYIQLLENKYLKIGINSERISLN